MNNDTRQTGFSAVELLITLFIGTIFLLAGYQLYNYTLKGNASADRTAQMSNLAYTYLRQYSSSAKQPCGDIGTTPYTAYTSSSVTVGTITNASASVVITCPYGASSNISLVTSSITFNGTTVSHAVYTN